MTWERVHLVVEAAEADQLGDALLELGALSVDAADAAAGTDAERPVFAEPGADASLWARTEITALFPEGSGAAGLAEEACAALGLRLSGLRVEAVAEQDWVHLTQAQFDPVRVSERLWVVPSWHAAPPEAQRVLRLDPGLAFGTGTHPTTRLCLQWLDRHLRPGQSVLDYGCGSGILAIAAGLLGAGRLAGVDVDPNAVRASRDNAVANGVSAIFSEPDRSPGHDFDVVVANILANPLRVLAPLVCAACAPGGHLVLSGILEPQADAVIEAYAPWVDFAAPLREEGWICLWGRRRTEAS